MKIFKIISLLSVMFLSMITISSHAVKPLISATNGLLQTKGTYFTVKPDYRECISPICGGWFVNAVNHKHLKCPDGSISKECYVGTNIINIPNLTLEQINQLKNAMNQSNVLIKGYISNTKDYGLLTITSAWLSATKQKPKGAFLSISDNNIRCVTYPCPSIDGLLLNKNIHKSLASYDLNAVSATKSQLAIAHAVVAKGNGLHISGTYINASGPAGMAHGIVASQFYLKLENTAPKFCRPTGCAGEICSNSDVQSICVWKPEYACYRSASCAAQANGDCGWVMDNELRRCLNSTVNELFLQQNIDSIDR